MADLNGLLRSLRTSDRPRLWVLIDAAGLERGRDDIDEDRFEQLECLFTGDLAIELKDVAPYLGSLDLQREDADLTLHWLSARECVVLLIDPQDRDLTFVEVHRHLRKFNVAYGPDGQPLIFRYYDGRALAVVLHVLDSNQRSALFGPFVHIVVPDADGYLIRLDRDNGRLTRAALSGSELPS